MVINLLYRRRQILREPDVRKKIIELLGKRWRTTLIFRFRRSAL